MDTKNPLRCRQRVLNEKQIGQAQGLFRQKADSEASVFEIVIAFSGAGVNDGSAELFHESDVFVHTALRHPDLFCQFRRRTGALDTNEVIDAV